MAMRSLLRVVAAAAVALAPALSAIPVAATGPAVGLSATSLDFGSVTWQQTSAAQVLTLTNTGDAALSITTIDFSGESVIPVDFRSPVEGCFFRTLAPGAQCQNQIVFQPQSGGPRFATLSIFDNAADSPQQVALRGIGTGAVLAFTPRFLDFGTVPLGSTSAPLTFTAVDVGDAPVTISKVALQLPSQPFAISADACTGATLGPGQRCSVSATVTPNNIGLTEGQLVNIFDNAGTGEQTYGGAFESLQASGGGPQLGFLNPVTSFNQGVGTVGSLPLQVFDNGTAAVVISSLAVDTTSTGFSISHDGCTGKTLPAGLPSTAPATCEVDIAFAPPAVGSFLANLVIHDNELGGAHSQTLSGTGFAPAAVPSPAAIDFGFQSSGMISPAQVVTLSNPSPQPLVVSSVTLGGANPIAFKLTSDTCSGTTVAAGGQCTVGVAMTPPFGFLFTATLSFSDNEPSSPPTPQTVALRGEGSSPTFAISTSQLSFGPVKANSSSAPQTVTVTNLSTGPLSVGFFPGAGLTRTGCSTPIPVAGSCVVSVSVDSPGVGAQTALLKIFDSASNQQVVEADWIGTTGQVFIEGPLAFGSMVQPVGTSLSTTALIRNGGQATLSFGQLTLTNAPPATITSDQCSNHTIAPGTNCAVTLTATPTAVGAWFTNLTVPSDSVISPNPTTLFIRGFAGPRAQAVFFPSSVAFSPVLVGGAEETQIVWLDNGLVAVTGAETLTISSVAIAGPDAAGFRIVWDGCSGLFFDGAFSCPVEVGFDPTAGRTFDATLEYTDNASGSPQHVALSGVGLTGATPSPAEVDFGPVLVGSKSPSTTVTLTNNSTSTITVSRVSVGGPNKGEFSITSETCQNQSLGPGGQCQVLIVFRPEAAGSRTAMLTFTDSASNSPQTVPLVGTGVTSR